MLLVGGRNKGIVIWVIVLRTVLMDESVQENEEGKREKLGTQPKIRCTAGEY